MPFSILFYFLFIVLKVGKTTEKKRVTSLGYWIKFNGAEQIDRARGEPSSSRARAHFGGKCGGVGWVVSGLGNI